MKDITQCSLVKFKRRFEGTYCHFMVGRVSQTSNRLVYCFFSFWGLNTKADLLNPEDGGDIHLRTFFSERYIPRNKFSNRKLTKMAFFLGVIPSRLVDYVTYRFGFWYRTVLWLIETFRRNTVFVFSVKCRFRNYLGCVDRLQKWSWSRFCQLFT